MIGDGAAQTAQLPADGRIVGGARLPGRSPQTRRWAGRFLDRLDPQARAAVLSLGKGNAIAAGGPVPNVVGQVVVLLSGWVEVTASAGTGRSFLLAIHHAGEVLDVGAWAAPGEVQVTAGAPTLIRQSPAGAFAAVLDAYPSAREAYCHTQCVLLRRATRQWIAGRAPVAVRVARTLAELRAGFAGRRDAAGRVVIPLSQSELADFADASLPAVHRELIALRDAGVITLGRRAVAIANLTALLAAAGTAAPLATTGSPEEAL